MSSATKPVEQKARELLEDRLVIIGHWLTGAHEKNMARDVWEAAQRIAGLNTDGARIRRLEDALDNLLASCGARERYHALEYAEAVAEAEEALSTPSKGVG